VSGASGPGDAPEPELTYVAPAQIRKNPNNPRRYFNDERLDLLRTSIQEVGVLVPLIAYPSPDMPGKYVLMDGERRWSSAIDIGLSAVPVRLIEPPDELTNLVTMFNIHSVREDWPLVSVALSLRELMLLSAETRESRLSEMTGLSRSTVRRAKRLLSLPDEELGRIQAEAHLDRAEQVHREDLYLEVERAESIIRREYPEIASAYARPDVIRQFVRKRETGALNSVTEFRAVSKIIAAQSAGALPRDTVVRGLSRLIADETLTPQRLLDDIGMLAVQEAGVARRASLLRAELSVLPTSERLGNETRAALVALRQELNRLLGEP
jgi:ParB family transcriptional regulator, chromosome partitioning protein